MDMENSPAKQECTKDDVNVSNTSQQIPNDESVEQGSADAAVESDAGIPIIDVQKFAEQAAVISKEHLSQASQNNRNKLQELVNNQGVLLESLQHENEKFSANDCFKQMEDMLSKCKHYNSKLLKIQKTMHDVTLRTAKVKKQCLKLQELKAKSLMEEEEAKRKELERENLLVARPAAADPKQAAADPKQAAAS